ncbi:hypothetical protein OF83DRAFT_469510 [Amylostereum chailletii]|nr:hypothetical protein OF83DRAFT_469510 [Amylostereum chailletii]
MHGIFLGEVKHLFRQILERGCMFTATGKGKKRRDPQARLEEFLQQIWWPSTVGRVPRRTTNISKADQWRSLATILPIALYFAWEVDGNIPEGDAPRPCSSTNAGKSLQTQQDLVKSRHLEALSREPATTTSEYETAAEDSLPMHRNYRKHYDPCLDFLTAVRIWTARSITPEEATRAEECHSAALSDLGRHACPPHTIFPPHESRIMTLHLSVGFLIRVLAVWCRTIQRRACQGENQRTLRRRARRNYDAKLGAKKCTASRPGMSLCGRSRYLSSELCAQLLNLEDIPNKTDDDHVAIAKLHAYVKGEKKPRVQCGTLQSLMSSCRERLQAQQGTGMVGGILLASESKVVNIKTLGLYQLILLHLQLLWRGNVQLVFDLGIWHPGQEPFVGTAARSFSHALVGGLRFGACTAHRGRGTSYAYMDGRVPVQIQYIIRVTHPRQDTAAPDLQASFAVVRRFVQDPSLPHMPWSRRSVDLGISIWEYQSLHAPEIIDLKRFTAHFALARVPVDAHRKLAWVVTSLDHLSEEPDNDVDIGLEDYNEDDWYQETILD